MHLIKQDPKTTNNIYTLLDLTVQRSIEWVYPGSYHMVAWNEESWVIAVWELCVSLCICESSFTSAQYIIVQCSVCVSVYQCISDWSAMSGAGYRDTGDRGYSRDTADSYRGQGYSRQIHDRPSDPGEGPPGLHSHILQSWTTVTCVRSRQTRKTIWTATWREDMKCQSQFWEREWWVWEAWPLRDRQWAMGGNKGWLETIAAISS